MTTFAKASFDAAGYLASRPTYPARLYEIITAYHKQDNTGQFRHALDVGCGPGFMALALAPSFEATTALDPSAKMIAVGMQPDHPAAGSTRRIAYAVGGAEDLSVLAPQSVDLAVAGQAAHWFDHRRTWGELARVVRPGGTVAYVGYGEMLFPSHPFLNKHITAHQGDAQRGIGPYWSQPGRSIVEGLLDAVPFPVAPTLPDSTLERLSRLPNLYPDGYPVPARIAEPAPVPGSSGWDAASAVRIKGDSLGRAWQLRPAGTGRWGWDSLEGYLRSASALHAYHEKNPDDKARRGGGAEGDIVDRLIVRLRQALRDTTGREHDEVEVAWPLVLVMIKREL